MHRIQLEQTREQKLLKQAIASLGIDRPILKIEALPNGLRLTLLGGEVVEWRARSPDAVTDRGRSHSVKPRAARRSRASAAPIRSGEGHDHPG